MSRPIPEPRPWPDPVEAALSRRLWAAVVLTTDLAVCRSIFSGRRVLARQLDAVALRRALRGSSFPHRDAYIEISAEMLDAVAEAGPLELKASTNRR